MFRKILIPPCILVFTACAPLATSAQPSPQTAMLAATCSKVMRLTPGQAQFDGCVSSLSDSLAFQLENKQAVALYRTCAQAGLPPDSPALARCMLDRKGAAATAAPMLDPAVIKPADNDPESYFSASFHIRRHREQYACAELGLIPDSGPFTSCVANLDSDLFNIDHPPE